jgi:uncharacterized repeat protein (TIGR03843 family)
LTDPIEPLADPVAVLRTGTVTLIGRMPYSSNATFLVEVTRPGIDPDDPDDDEVPGVRAIYKPERGERPLWDFPPGLWKREVAASVLDDALGWRAIPPTIARTDAPLDEGSLQLFIDADFSQHYFTLMEDESTHDQFRRLCAFDILANNTDRKSGHCLVDDDGHIWGIDNGLAFAAEFKLRTVIWDFGGEPLPDEITDDVNRFLDRGLPPALCDLLDPFERDALLTRARALVRGGRFPTDDGGRAYPWPLV